MGFAGVWSSVFMPTPFNTGGDVQSRLFSAVGKDGTAALPCNPPGRKNGAEAKKGVDGGRGMEYKYGK